MVYEGTRELGARGPLLDLGGEVWVHRLLGGGGDDDEEGSEDEQGRLQHGRRTPGLGGAGDVDFWEGYHRVGRFGVRSFAGRK